MNLGLGNRLEVYVSGKSEGACHVTQTCLTGSVKDSCSAAASSTNNSSDHNDGQFELIKTINIVSSDVIGCTL